MRVHSGVSLLTALLLAGCSTIAGLRDDDHTQNSNNEQVEQFRQQAMQDLEVTATSSISFSSGVAYLSTHVSVTNAGAERVSASFMGNPWLIRVFDSPDRSSTPVWRTEDANRSVQPLLRPLEIAPGATADFQTTPERVDRVFNGLPAGTYYVSVDLRLQEPKVMLGSWSAGEVTVPAP